MLKLCFVVHRYAPFPGGSEYYVQWMAEECVARGHTVTVLTGEHGGDLNGVRVTSDAMVLNELFDLIVVHGADVNVQDCVLSHIKQILSPILYLIIKPSNSEVSQHALQYAKYVGCSTFEDWDHVEKYNATLRAVKVRHGINTHYRTGIRGQFRQKYNIGANVPLFLSCGGYWANKRMKELAEVFEAAKPDDAILITTGYDNRSNLMPSPSSHVRPMMLEDEQDVANALADADVYIMNSDAEGFGLVLLECMLNRTPWISRELAGAMILKSFGTTYTTEKELRDLLPNYKVNCRQVERGYEYVQRTHLIQHTVDDILKLLKH